MCGRFGLFDTSTAKERFGEEIDFSRYNIAPSFDIPVIADGDLTAMKWGMEAPWDPKKGIINARSEGLLAKRSFKKHVEARRCLIPANGFFEWDKEKNPFWFTTDQPLFSFAGFYTEDERVVIITTEANKVISEVHHRMPVIFTPEQEEIWTSDDTQKAIKVLQPYKGGMTALKVSKAVNSPANDSRELLNSV